jgi:hypothetical protein
MQENKFLEIIKNEEQMAKLTPVNEDDKKATDRFILWT